MRYILGNPLLLSSLLFCAAALSKVEAQPAGTPPAPIMGEYAGTFTPVGAQAVKAEAKVLADEDGHARIVILYPAGQAQTSRIELAGQCAGDEVALTGSDWGGGKLPVKWSGKVTRAALSITGAGDKGGTAAMKRVAHSSPTLGQKPPEAPSC